MKNFRWNESKEHVGSFWNCNTNQIEPYVTTIKSDKDILKISGFEYRIVLESLCRIVLELVEIEESRNKEKIDV